MKRVSASSLRLLDDCERCFHLHMNKVRRPGIVAQITNGIDRALKLHHDRHRKRGTFPPELRADVKGELFPDMELMTKWRHWQSGLKLKYQGLQIIGAFDEVIEHRGKLAILDVKTKGTVPTEDANKWNQLQMDLYTLLLEDNDYPTHRYAYLSYYSPKIARNNANFGFDVTTFKVDVDPNRAKKIIRKAARVLKKKPNEVKASDDCQYCGWGNA